MAKHGGSTTAVVIIMLGLMTFGVWHEQDSGKAGGQTILATSQMRELNSEILNPTLKMHGTLLNKIFVMILGLKVYFNKKMHVGFDLYLCRAI